MGQNEEQLEKWNGDAGRRWAEYQEHLDRALEAFGQSALATFQAQAGERVIDVGCGAGATLIPLAEAVGSTGRVLGLDASQPLLDLARARTSGLPQVEFIQADASVHPLETGFDGIFSRFGVMFFDHPAQGLEHLRRALRPGGRMVFVCWQGLRQNPWIEQPLLAVAPVLSEQPAAPVPNAPGPFAFADREYLLDQVSRAGFGDIEVKEVLDQVIVGPGGVDEALEFAMCLGPCERIFSEQSSAVQAQMKELLLELYGRNLGAGGSVQLGGAAWVLSALNPSI